MNNNSSQNLKIFKSSAGSGKTYTLAKEYLKLVFANKLSSTSNNQEDYFKHILAITFTNDAANEMKERVLKYLKEFSELEVNQSHHLLDEIIIELNSEYPKITFKKSDLILRSGHLIRSILHNYSEFNIQTIDSFTNLIGKSFSKELGLPGDYEIYLDTKEKINQSVDLLLDEISDNTKELNEWLFQFVEDQIENDKTWNIAFKLKEFAHELEKETKFELLESLRSKTLLDFKHAKIKLTKELNNFEKAVKAYSKTGLDILSTHNIDHNDLTQKSRGIKTFLTKNLNVPFSVCSNKALNDGIENDYNWIHKDYKGGNSERINNALKSPLIALQEYLTKYEPIYNSYNNVAKNIYQLALLSEIKVVLTRLKKEDEQVFLSDLNEKIRDVVIKEPVPFIYEKVGVKFKHILIDEFQDTSGFQWNNLIPLLSNSLSQSYKNLIVGDAKQAIYAFRGGKPELLVDLPFLNNLSNLTDESLKVKGFEDDAYLRPLNNNYRSASEIVEFNNKFFEWIRDNKSEGYYQGLEGFYDDVNQIAKKHFDSEIRIDVIQKDSTKAKDELSKLKCEFVLDYINHCKGLDYAERDIAILSRRNEDSKLISKFLIENEIQVLSDESLLLESSSIIQLLIKVLYLIKEPSNQEYRFAILNGLINHLELTQIDWEVVKKEIKKQSIKSFILYLLDFSKKKYDEKSLLVGSLYQIVLAWIKCFSLDSDVNQQVFIDHFLDILSNPNSSTNKNVNLFIAYWEEKHDSISISSSEEQNAVRIVSIHRSKGLEYPIVILPFPDWRIDRSSKIWTRWKDGNPSDIEIAVLNENKTLIGTEFEYIYNKTREQRFIEELNLLYVAMTRASKGLYIINTDAKGNTFGKVLNDFLQENSMKYTEQIFKNEIEYFSYRIKEFTKKSEEKITSESVFENFSVSDRESLGRNLKWNQDYSFSEDQLIQIEKGRAFHLLLAQLKDFSDKDEVLAIADEILHSTLKSKFSVVLDNLLSDKTSSLLFEQGWKVYLEQELLFKNKLVIPDRLQLRDDELVIVDYKTGNEDQKYIRQIQAYGDAARSIFNKKSIKLYIIYLDPFKIVKVS